MAEEDPWGFDDAEESTPAVAESTAVATTDVNSLDTKMVLFRLNLNFLLLFFFCIFDATQAAATAAAPAAAAAAGDDQPLPEAEVPPQEDDKYRRPVTLYKHWVR